MLSKDSLNSCINIINGGGVVLVQTDTIFGLLCLGTSDAAIQKVTQIKKRTKNSFGFFIRDINIAKKYAIFNEIQQKCFEKIFPGYYTLILEATKLSMQVIPERALGKHNNTTTIGLRIPKNDFCIKLLDNFDIPILATSANISGEEAPDTINKVDKTIINSVDGVFYDENIETRGLNSTIIDITNINDSNIIRQGSGDVSILKPLIKFK